MVFPNKYKCFSNQKLKTGEYSIKPIRYEDRIPIMHWRNDQIRILRQRNLLSEFEQDSYFQQIVAPLFHTNKPKQLLFSFFKNNLLIGYGGLVHIDWINKNAEISFLLNTSYNDKLNYLATFSIFLELIEKVALSIHLHKIYTYGYDIEDYRFSPLIDKHFKLEVNYRNHIKIDDQMFNVKIYSKILK